jgi:hypothetical protein
LIAIRNAFRSFPYIIGKGALPDIRIFPDVMRSIRDGSYQVYAVVQDIVRLIGAAL